MKVGMPISYAGGFTETVAQIADYERAGLDVISLPEAYSFDSVSQLGYLAAKTSTVELTSSILNIYSRTPALLAMTAAGLDFVSGGRFILGIGTSGPQVVEGFHGVRYDAPLGRTREVAQICPDVPVDAVGCLHEPPYLGRGRFGGQEGAHRAPHLLLLGGEDQAHPCGSLRPAHGMTALIVHSFMLWTNLRQTSARPIAAWRQIVSGGPAG
jgi:alkanesulfonate monooxygenase SsuD/methylene tetrahydromethanopterin reductase-like flavin-dependent oxidoreductase (luciferase family)